jgi:6-phosphogluconate dehydrogenase
MDIAIIGLGRMGANMARRLLAGGHKVSVYNRTAEKTRELEKEGASGFLTVAELIKSLPAPRIVWLMLPSGEATEKHLEISAPLLSAGDIIIDGGNGYYKDDIRRAAELSKKGILYLDAGVSGGIWGLKKGYAAMIGGSAEAFKTVEPLIKSLAPEGGYMHCGGPGAGHFVKMTHNAVEYGMMESLAEGFELLRASGYGETMDLKKVASTWNSASIVKSWLLELLVEILGDKKGLEELQGYVEDSGEARWAIKEGVDSGVSMEAISASLYKRFNSRQKDIYSDKILAALRREFGGHMAAKKGEDVKTSAPGAGAAGPARPEGKK